MHDYFKLDSELTSLTLNTEAIDLENFPIGSFLVNLQLIDQFKSVNNHYLSILENYDSCATSTFFALSF